VRRLRVRAPRTTWRRRRRSIVVSEDETRCVVRVNAESRTLVWAALTLAGGGDTTLSFDADAGGDVASSYKRVKPARGLDDDTDWSDLVAPPAVS